MPVERKYETDGVTAVETPTYKMKGLTPAEAEELFDALRETIKAAQFETKVKEFEAHLKKLVAGVTDAPSYGSPVWYAVKMLEKLATVREHRDAGRVGNALSAAVDLGKYYAEAEAKKWLVVSIGRRRQAQVETWSARGVKARQSSKRSNDAELLREIERVRTKKPDAKASEIAQRLLPRFRSSRSQTDKAAREALTKRILRLSSK